VAEELVDGNVHVDVQKVDATQSEAQETPATHDINGVIEVEGDNAEEGLHHNSLDQQRWSAPPLELEAEGGPANDTAS
jgi:hypothetical protein